MSTDRRDRDRADIEQLLVQYATGIDQRDWKLFRSCFTDDALGDYGDIGTFAGADSLTDFMIAAHGGFGSTNHMLSNFVIHVDGDRATARSYVHVVLAFAHDRDAWIDGVGTYEDTLVRTDSGWRIARRTFRSTRSFSHT
ncbi:MAG: nuclear transport factor 2 family protein [Acidimicrobiales bacterium]